MKRTIFVLQIIVVHIWFILSTVTLVKQYYKNKCNYCTDSQYILFGLSVTLLIVFYVNLILRKRKSK